MESSHPVGANVDNVAGCTVFVDDIVIKFFTIIIILVRYRHLTYAVLSWPTIIITINQSSLNGYLFAPLFSFALPFPFLSPLRIEIKT